MNGPAGDTNSSGTPTTIGLVVAVPADQRLLIDFLTESGYAVHAGQPADLARAEGVELSLVLADERAAGDYTAELLALRQQAVQAFMPLLILLPAGANSTHWLEAGFDDVLRVPLRKAELVARLEVYLQLRRRLRDLAAHRQAALQLNQDKAELQRRVTERTGELRKANAELRRLTQKIVRTQEEEREGLARELHDEIGQALTAVNFNLQAFQHLIVDPIVAERLQDSLNIIEDTLQQVRDISLDLHPAILDHLGLVAAIQWYVERQAARTGVRFEFVLEQPPMNLAADVKTACFRLTQEALTNILRHAQAQTVQVELRQRDEELELVIRDDGIGFDVRAARAHTARGESLGLLGMKERVRLLKGHLQIKSARGRGTEIRARFPLAPPARAKRRNGAGAGGRHEANSDSAGG